MLARDNGTDIGTYWKHIRVRFIYSAEV